MFSEFDLARELTQKTIDLTQENRENLLKISRYIPEETILLATDNSVLKALFDTINIAEQKVDEGIADRIETETAISNISKSIQQSFDYQEKIKANYLLILDTLNMAKERGDLKELDKFLKDNHKEVLKSKETEKNSLNFLKETYENLTQAIETVSKS